MSKFNSDRARRAIAILVGLAALGTEAGCTTTGHDLVRDGTVTVEDVASRHARFSRVTITREGSATMIDGELTRLPPAPYVVPGRVELQLIGPGQDLLYQVTTDYHRKDKRYHRLWFLLRVPMAPPAGSTVRLLHRPRGLSPEDNA